MKNRVIRHRLVQGLTAFALLAAVMGFASVAGAVYYPPSDRSVTWQGNVGVLGDIPNRTVIYKTLSPSGADDTSAIQTAINNCPSGQVVLLTKGTFNITTINIKSNVTLRGAGMGSTILKGNLTSYAYAISLGNNYGDSSIGTSYNLASGYTKGSTSITTSTSTGWQAGDIILIDQLNNPTGNPPVSNVGCEGANTWDSRSNATRVLSQVVKVTSVSGNSATLEIPLYWSFDPTLSPQATKLNIGAQNSGMEKLTIDSSSSWSTFNQQRTVQLWGAANNWLLGVEIYGIWGAGVGGGSMYRNTIRSCRIHVAHQYTTSSYAIYNLYGFSANLVEDCIFDDVPSGPVIASGSGNVFAYNYSTNIHWAPNNVFQGIYVNHGSHPIMNLCEGNYMEGSHFEADWIHGTSSHNTFFKNRVFNNAAVTSGYTSQLADVIIWLNNTYYNVIGNVLGNSGFENYYQVPGAPLSGSTRTIYALGCNSNNGAGSYGLETSTLLRYGNWDGYNNKVLWDTTVSNDTTLPPSLYLTAKPSWWPTINNQTSLAQLPGTTNPLPWPPIDPTVSNPTACNIPARQRYLLGNPPAQGAPIAQ
jgi:hypothetical protein